MIEGLIGEYRLRVETELSMCQELFRQVKVAEQADQRNQYPPRLGAVRLAHLFVYRFVQPHSFAARFNGTAGGQSPANQ
jgi:hypothetical protein